MFSAMQKLPDQWPERDGGIQVDVRKKILKYTAGPLLLFMLAGCAFAEPINIRPESGMQQDNNLQRQNQHMAPERNTEGRHDRQSDRPGYQDRDDMHHGADKIGGFPGYAIRADQHQYRDQDCRPRYNDRHGNDNGRDFVIAVLGVALLGSILSQNNLNSTN